jgi:hypothetical protein
MSILQLTKTLPDGRSVEFHVPAEFHLDMSTHDMQIIVESYETEEAARNRTMSSAKSVVDVPLPDWSPIYADNLLNFVTSDSAWSDAQILP